VDPRRPTDSEDPLRRLEERLERASDVAERLVAEMAAEASITAARLADRIKPPPAGWQFSSAPARDGGSEPGDHDERLLSLLRSLEELVPPDLQQRLAEALAQLLAAIRALVDWYLERLGQQRSEPPTVQDIPIL
jgi:hypothetical protein